MNIQIARTSTTALLLEFFESCEVSEVQNKRVNAFLICRCKTQKDKPFSFHAANVAFFFELTKELISKNINYPAF